MDEVLRGRRMVSTYRRPRTVQAFATLTPKWVSGSDETRSTDSTALLFPKLNSVLSKTTVQRLTLLHKH